MMGMTSGCLTFQLPHVVSVLEHVTHICQVFSGDGDWSGFSHVYTIVQSVGLSLVIALHIKDVSILGEELFQHSGFSITQVWPGWCHHVLQL
jgi:hypothetical protein